MGYMHINNLYKNQLILQFKRCYALEKIHGTSAHIGWDGAQQKLSFFSGGAKHEAFVNLFNPDELTEAFISKFGSDPRKVYIYGEAYGGKMQGMSPTYGDKLRFIAFDVLIDHCWLQVEQAHSFVRHFGLEFVDYEQIDTTLAEIDRCRDLPSTQAARNGVNEPEKTIREGIVLRPPFEVTLNNGERLIAKHKRDEFRENKSPSVMRDPTKVESLMRMTDLAEEWCTPRRFEHVTDQLFRERDEKKLFMQDIPLLIKLMCEDIERESVGEAVITDTKAFGKAVGAKIVRWVKDDVDRQLREAAQ